MPVQQKIWH